jgi:hypothetical protein
MLKGAMVGVLATGMCAFMGTTGQGTRGDAFVGGWHNVSEDGIKQAWISNVDNRMYIRVLGSSLGGGIDWGKVKLHLVGNDVADKNPQYAFAKWDAEFADVYMVLHLSHGELVLETIDIFKDKSGRSNYRSVQRLRRIGK